MKTIDVSIPAAIYAELETKIAGIKTEVPGDNPGEQIIRPVFAAPIVENWLRQVIWQNCAQFGVFEEDDELKVLRAQIDQLQREHNEKANKIQVAAK
jgi:hypothetical protein